MIYNLSAKSNENLISDLKDLVKRERELQTELLHYLKEVENRRIYLEKGYPSLFSFMTEELAYSEGAAQRRIQAMRLIKDIPEVEKKIKDGVISLTVASQVQGYIQRENKKRKLEKSPKFTSMEKLDLVKKLAGTSARICERKLAEISPETGIPREKTRILSPEKTLIQFVAGQDLMEKIQRLKELTSHTNPEGKYEKLFSKLVEMTLDKLDPERRLERRKKRSTQISEPKETEERLKAEKKHPNISVPPDLGPVGSPGSGGAPRTHLGLSPKTPPPSTVRYWAPPAPAVGRYISRKIRDQIWFRDGGLCQYRDKRTGKQCASKHLLELDHRVPFSWGGEHSLKNLRLHCKSHNLYRVQASELLL